MKFFFPLLALLLTGCVLPSHIIRVNESLPKDAPIEQQSVVAYRYATSDSCLEKDCGNDIRVINPPTIRYDGTRRQIEINRMGRIPCDPKLPDGPQSVIWYKDNIPYKTLKMFCDDASQKFKAVLYEGEKQVREIQVEGVIIDL